LALATAAQAQTWTPDTMATGTGYSQDAFYNLTTGTVGAGVANNNWDLGFITGDPMSNSVMVNHAGNQKSGKLYDLGLDANVKFGTDLTLDTVGKTGSALELRNAPDDWDGGAFIQNSTGPMNFGWGDYDVNTHVITGNKVYCLVNSGGAYQVWIEEYKASGTPSSRLWKFHVANLDGTNITHEEFAPHPTYTNKLHAYYDLATRTFVNREPDMTTWHLLATKYLDVYHGAPAGTPLQSTSGIVTNINVELAAATPIVPNDANYQNFTTFSESRNVIGGNYKFVSTTPPTTPPPPGWAPGWVLNDSLSYFIKIKQGVDSADIYQVYFDYFPASTSGEVKIGLQKRKVFDYIAQVSVTDVNDFINNVVIAPNPSVGGATNILVDAKQALKNAQLTVVDLNGRVVMKSTMNINAGFQQLRLDVSKFQAGIYMINLSGAGFSNTQKVIVK